MKTFFIRSLFINKKIINVDNYVVTVFMDGAIHSTRVLNQNNIDCTTELSKIVATKLAKKAQEKKITKIYFDRGIYRYHGRVKVFAETLRENGMEF